MSQSFLLPENIRRERRARLATRNFGTIRTIEWGALERLHLRRGVEELLSVGSWLPLLTVDEPAYRDITLEFLSSFVCRTTGRDDPYALIF